MTYNFFSFLVCLMFITTHSHSQNLQKSNDYFVNGVTWYATDNTVIEAHGAGILKKDSTYYLFGEDHSKGAGNKTGITCYSSYDLIQWRNLGSALPKDLLPIEYRDIGVCERPKVLYNKATGKYIMWMHLDAEIYSHAMAGIAVSDKPEGPYQFIKKFRPVNESTYRDMCLFEDSDGKAYVMYAAEENATLYICRLSNDYTDIEHPIVEGKTWARALVNESREAPAPFKYNNKYFLITSGTTGWAPNAAKWHTADNILGPWKTMGNPCTGKEAALTFRSQGTYVLPAPGKDDNCFIFMADRWIGNKTNSGTYVWLPFTIQHDSVSLQYIDKWQPGIFDNKYITKDAPVITEKNKFLSWKKDKVSHIYKVYKNGQEILTTSSNVVKIPDESAGKIFNYYITASNLYGAVSNPSNIVKAEWIQPENVWLSDISCDRNIQGYSTLQNDNSIGGGALSINGVVFKKGIGTHAYSEIIYTICGKYHQFESWLGIDDYHSDLGKGAAQFEIYGDDTLLYRSKILKINSPAAHVLLNIDSVNELKLVVTDGGDGIEYDHADWGNARLLIKSR